MFDIVFGYFTGSPRPTMVHGACPDGVDACAAQLARTHNLKVEEHPADWSEHERAAGPIRNQQMVDSSDALVAIWDGKSRGTKDIIQKAIKAGLEVHIHQIRNRR